ncbi:MAG: hypothetical protein HS113_13875 [Verrucomicrobiales bacterium]|nr:hypothetical protein [Verrucomicrobiales bacterium]
MDEAKLAALEKPASAPPPTAPSPTPAAPPTPKALEAADAKLADLLGGKP